MFLNPMSVSCETCGKQQAHDPKDLAAFKVHCIQCDILLIRPGRFIREVQLKSTLFATTVELAFEIEDHFGVTLPEGDDRILDSVDLRQFVEDFIASVPQLAPQRDAVRAYAVKYLRSEVEPEKVEAVESSTFSELFTRGGDL